MSDKILQPQDRKAIIKASLLAGTARAMDAIARVDQRFSHRGWPKDDRMHIAVAALCYVKLGIGMQIFRVPPGSNDAKCWEAITPRAPAQQIVDALEIGDILQPVRILSIVKP